MKIEISYTELSFLKELTHDKRMLIWREEYLPRIKNRHKKNIGEINDLFKEIMECEVNSNTAPCSDKDRCTLLLSKLNKLEQEMNEEIKG